MPALNRALDYVVVKIPKWPFDKFLSAKRTLTTQMKATGEVMSICQSFEGALMKALRSLEQNIYSLDHGDFSRLSDGELEHQLYFIDDHRLFCVAEAIRRGFTLEHIHEINKIDLWFLYKIKNLVDMEKRLRGETLTAELLEKLNGWNFRIRPLPALPECRRRKSSPNVIAMTLWRPLKW